MTIIVHKAESRGRSCNSWLSAYHTFSCDDYYDSERINFGALRVINDNRLAPGKGFRIHPHKNMEIITIPLNGELQHDDAKKNQLSIGVDDVQIISAGTGIFHSEVNSSKTKPVEFLQIWIMPRERNIHPNYQNINIKELISHNQINLIISPDDTAPLSINQDAWISMCNIVKGEHLKYQLHHPSNGAYIFIVSGEIKINDTIYCTRDGIGITDVNFFDIEIINDSSLLIIEVPMHL